MTTSLTTRIAVGAMTLAALALSGGCASTATDSEDASATMTQSPPLAVAHTAVLLVSREDGSVVQQNVPLEADFCMKSSTGPETTCFTQGSAIYDAAGILVGHEMLETRINLYASPN